MPRLGEVGRDLSRDDGGGLAGGVLRGALSDAEDRPEPGLDRARELLRDTRVVVALIPPDLGVSDDRTRGEVHEHGGRDLRGEGAALGPVKVLRVHRDRGPAERIGHGGERDRRRRDTDGHSRLTVRRDVASERDRVRDAGRVHLPVADDELLGH